MENLGIYRSDLDRKVNVIFRVVVLIWLVTLVIAAFIFVAIDVNGGVTLMSITHGIGSIWAMHFAAGVVDKDLRNCNDAFVVQVRRLWTYQNAPALCAPLLRLMFSRADRRHLEILESAVKLFQASFVTGAITVCLFVSSVVLFPNRFN